ncbi:hypothetical protein C8T65DRAFT_693394 [Cerioporus squamosus]|nr:hypothetical protein C8T65DRAFT_693394 [Cerioporus squamosus]
MDSVTSSARPIGDTPKDEPQSDLAQDLASSPVVWFRVARFPASEDNRLSTQRNYDRIGIGCPISLTRSAEQFSSEAWKPGVLDRRRLTGLLLILLPNQTLPRTVVIPKDPAPIEEAYLPRASLDLWLTDLDPVFLHMPLKVKQAKSEFHNTPPCTA